MLLTESKISFLFINTHHLINLWLESRRCLPPSSHPAYIQQLVPSLQFYLHDFLKDIQSYYFPSTHRCNHVLTKSGSCSFALSYSSFSYFKQHIKRPHRPEIFVGFSDKFWSFAILIETGSKSPRMSNSKTSCRKVQCLQAFSPHP